MEKVVTTIHGNLDSTMDTVNVEVKGFLRKRKVYCLTWLSFVLLGIANILDVIAFSTPGWAWTVEVAGKIHMAGKYYGLYGVWYFCWMDMKSSSLRVCESWSLVSGDDAADWLYGFQAASVMAVVFGLAAFSIQLACICMPGLYRKKVLLISFVTAAALAGSATCAAFITFAVSFLDDARSCCKPELVREIMYFELWYSFVISCISAGFYFAATVVGIMEIVVSRRKTKQMEELESSD